MRTCVIGGHGFVGRHVVRALLSSGRDVLVLGRRRDRPDELPQAAAYASCDLIDRISLRHHLEGVGEIVSLAHATPPVLGSNDLLGDHVANLQPVLVLLEEAERLVSLRKLIVTSSGGTVYGVAGQSPITEDTSTAPVSPYGIIKLAIERYSLMFHLLKSLPVVVVRPSNVYGIGQRAFTGQGFIATAIGHVLQDDPIAVFGDGMTIRDYIHVDDVASGMLAALQMGKVGEIYNIGTSIGRSNLEIVGFLRQLAVADGIQLKVEQLPARGFDVPSNVLSYEKLFAQTGWSPKEHFEERVAEMWSAMKASFASNG
jgi:UDP-glucose 4-epimerase